MIPEELRRLMQFVEERVELVEERTIPSRR